MARPSLDWRDGAAMRYGGSEPLHRFQYPTTHHSTSVNVRKIPANHVIEGYGADARRRHV